MNVKIAVMCLAGFCASQLSYAQVSPKSGVSKKRNLNAKHSRSQNAQKLQMALFQGFWSDCLECNAVFFTEGHRVKFFDHIGDTENEKEYRTYWKISNNKLSFYYSGGLVVTDEIIKLNKDSLVLYRKNVGTSRYVRLK